MFYLYNTATAARRIARDLRVPRFYPYKSLLRTSDNPQSMTHIVNWGCGGVRFDTDLSVLNADISTAVSKVATYTALRKAEIPCPHWTTWGHVARDWGDMYLGRHDGLSGGRGITIYQAGERPGRHDFYTKVIDCHREYRVHVFNEQIIAIQKKRLANATSIIHNHTNGVLFQSYNVATFDIGREATARIKDISIRAMAAVGLDFGAVDVIQERGTNDIYVLEVNTAPGIRTNAIYNAYLEAFRPYVKD